MTARSQQQGGSETTETLSGCACFNARSAARAITDLYDRTIGEAGLRTTQFAILSAIELGGAITMQALAAALGLDPSTMTRTLRPLESDGLVRTAAGGDRRAKQLELSPRGAQKVRECRRLWREAQDELRDKLGGEVFDRLVGDLAAVTEALRD